MSSLAGNFGHDQPCNKLWDTNSPPGSFGTFRALQQAWNTTTLNHAHKKIWDITSPAASFETYQSPQLALDISCPAANSKLYAALQKAPSCLHIFGRASTLIYSSLKQALNCNCLDHESLGTTGHKFKLTTIFSLKS
jgi:hypothetical protein